MERGAFERVVVVNLLMRGSSEMGATKKESRYIDAWWWRSG